MYGKCILILLRDFLTLKIKAHKATQPREYTIQNESVLYSTVPLQLLFTLHFEFKVFIPPPPRKKYLFQSDLVGVGG